MQYTYKGIEDWQELISGAIQLFYKYDTARAEKPSGKNNLISQLNILLHFYLH